MSSIKNSAMSNNIKSCGSKLRYPSQIIMAIKLLATCINVFVKLGSKLICLPQWVPAIKHVITNPYTDRAFAIFSNIRKLLWPSSIHEEKNMKGTKPR
ncbi:hypothetical protein F7308_0601 [Francisella salina]|uniref:Uncharacterized protein n=1 Tax=Francisella salina TaxID=573569 RepID=A0ABM5M8K6_FRAST|nr:hypothetical protein F7308_0601 [Francisella salina]